MTLADASCAVQKQEQQATKVPKRVDSEFDCPSRPGLGLFTRLCVKIVDFGRSLLLLVALPLLAARFTALACVRRHSSSKYEDTATPPSPSLQHSSSSSNGAASYARDGRRPRCDHRAVGVLHRKTAKSLELMFGRSASSYRCRPRS